MFLLAGPFNVTVPLLPANDVSLFITARHWALCGAPWPPSLALKAAGTLAALFNNGWRTSWDVPACGAVKTNWNWVNIQIDYRISHKQHNKRRGVWRNWQPIQKLRSRCELPLFFNLDRLSVNKECQRRKQLRRTVVKIFWFISLAMHYFRLDSLQSGVSKNSNESIPFFPLKNSAEHWSVTEWEKALSTEPKARLGVRDKKINCNLLHM